MAEEAKQKPPAVQGAAPAYWFFWWIWVKDTRHSYGPQYMTDYDAWQWEFRMRSQYLGVSMQRWVWTGSRWLLDERADPQLMASQPIPGYKVGAVPVQPPIRGTWDAKGFPAAVTLQGRVFRKAEWAWPRDGVIAQYREDSPLDSRHLFVLADGSFVIDHVDEVNPDGPKGNPLAHFMADVLLRPAPSGRG